MGTFSFCTGILESTCVSGSDAREATQGKSAPRQMTRQRSRNRMTGGAARAEAPRMEEEMVRGAGPDANKAGREGCSMRKGIRGIWLLPVALACLLGISSCGNGGTITVTSVTIYPAP